MSRKNWVPDEKATHCKRCNVYFGFSRHGYFGKHHCRICGEVVCNNCTENRLPVEGWEGQGPQRVCNVCYTTNQNTTCDSCGSQLISSPFPFYTCSLCNKNKICQQCATSSYTLGSWTHVNVCRECIANLNQHNHIAAVVDYSRRKQADYVDEYHIIIYEIQNLYRNILLKDRFQSDSLALNSFVSDIGVEQSVFGSEVGAKSQQTVLKKFGMPTFSINTVHTHLDEQHFLHYLFSFKEFQRLCLATSPKTAQWMPKTFVCAIDSDVARDDDLLNEIYESAYNFLGNGEWVLKVEGALGAGNAFINSNDISGFKDSIFVFTTTRGSACILLIEQVLNVCKPETDNTKKIYRALIYYNVATREFRMQNIHAYLARNTFDSHLAPRSRYYSLGIEGADQDRTQQTRELKRDKVDRNLNVEQYKPGLFKVFRMLCEHMATFDRDKWGQVMQEQFLGQYIKNWPLNGKLLFYDEDTVLFMIDMYKSIVRRVSGTPPRK